jgi:cyclic pyranopterin phosphate synthase
VRLSLTDRCDLACVYCRPHRHDGYAEKRLELDAWKAMVDGLVKAGVRRVRLTGGEPLLHPDVVEVIAHLASLGLDDVALTTNATRLEKLAAPLRAAGLRRINVSLDSLDAHRFLRMTRGGNLALVVRGIDAALAAGFDEVKLNAVVMRGENDVELESLVRWSWDRGIVPRLLEIMMIGEGATLADRVVTASEMRQELTHLLCDEEPIKETDRGPARYVRARHDPHLRVGFISGTSDTYCKGCDRLRVPRDQRRRRGGRGGARRGRSGRRPGPRGGLEDEAGRRDLEGLHRGDGGEGLNPGDRRLTVRPRPRRSPRSSSAAGRWSSGRCPPAACSRTSCGRRPRPAPRSARS